jgi:hypothetical protein
MLVLSAHGKIRPAGRRIPRTGSNPGEPEGRSLPAMSTLGRSSTVAVTVSALAAIGSLVNVASSVFVLAFPLIPIRPDLNIISPPALRDRAFALVLAAAAAAAIGVAVTHAAPSRGWTGLLLGGTGLTSVAILSGAETLLDDAPGTWVLVAAGAGPVLVVIGLLGAATWLRHGGAAAAGALVAGSTLASPLIGTAVLLTLASALIPGTGVSAVHATHLVLAGLSVAGAVVAFVAALGPGVAPPRPSAGVTMAGVVGGFLLLAPDVFLQLVWSPDPLRSYPADPQRTLYDSWYLLLALAGLVIVVVAVGLAAQRGMRGLGAILGTGLVLYGCAMPIMLAERSIHAPATLGFALIGFVAGCLLAMTRSRVWGGAACVLVAAVILAAFAFDRNPDIGAPVEMPEVLAAMLVMLSTFAAVTAVATVTLVGGGGTWLPAMLGVVALVIQVGLDDAGAVLEHSSVQRAGAWQLNGPILASGVTLLLGGVLVLAVSRMRAAQEVDQAVLSPAVR